MTLKLRAKVNFPATVEATGGLQVVKANGAWTVSPDWSYLSLETAIPDASARQIWTFNPSAGSYARLSVQALIDNLPAGPPGSAATIAAGTTTTGKAGTSASASNSGTSSAAILDFSIPRGADAGMRYAFESSTSMAAPASGGLRLNNASLASVTAMAVNATNSDAVDVSDFVATWDDSTNSVKGYVEIRKEGSGAVLGLYQLASVTDNGTWLQLALTYVSGSGSLTAADSVYLVPYRVGNAGTNGAVAVSGTPTVNQFGAWVDSTTLKGVSITGLVKGNGASAPTAAVSGTDYAPPTSGSSILKGNGAGGFSNASAGTDYQAADAQLFSNIPQNSQSAAYTLVAADAQKHIYHPSADTTARIWTIPANASVAFPIGTAVTFVNDTSGGVITIAITTDTLVLAGAGTTGSRSLAANGIATAIKITSTRWMISGTGLT
jgi:hypothetical protein